MTSIVSLRQASNNASVVKIGYLQLYFSYGTCIAFDINKPGDYRHAFHPDYRKFSTTTSKHIREMGLTNFDNAADGDDFNRQLSEAMALPGALS